MDWRKGELSGGRTGERGGGGGKGRQVEERREKRRAGRRVEGKRRGGRGKRRGGRGKWGLMDQAKPHFTLDKLCIHLQQNLCHEQCMDKNIY